MRARRLAIAAAPVALAALALAARGGADVPTKAPPPAAAFEVSDCKACHEKAVTGMQATPHARLEQSCASCHGDVSAHLKSNLEKGEPGPIVSVARLKAAEVNKTCLTCHDKGHQANWAGGLHDRRGVSCASCHSVHDFKSVKAQLKTATQLETCGSCHQQIRAKQMRASHHPIREGLMTCTSCHDAHDGTRPKMISAEWVNEKCYACHAEKRGPFLWEHAPVRENCMGCHEPHGTNHQKLLVASQPYLCQRCHLNTRHPGTLYDGRNTVVAASISNRAVGNACRNCHQNIHGGNAPSGPYLGR
jgi:DmsE family decaheme c-type cytochrome